MTRKRYYTFMIDTDLAEGLKKLKEREHLPEAQILRGALRDHLGRKGFLKASRRSTSAKKATLVIPAETYLRETKGAASHIFAGIAAYLERYRSIRWPSQATTREELELGMQDLRVWFGVQFSLSVLCGAVLEIADKGLEVCSPNDRLPPSCTHFAKTDEARFCVGREIHGLPLGAIVHAGRNQHVHWSDEDPEAHTAGFHRFTRGVFRELVHAYYSDSMMDLVYDLGNSFAGGPRSRADSLVLSTIRWTEYGKYESDMRAMLTPAKGE